MTGTGTLTIFCIFFQGRQGKTWYTKFCICFLFNPLARYSRGLSLSSFCYPRHSRGLSHFSFWCPRNSRGLSQYQRLVPWKLARTQLFQPLVHWGLARAQSIQLLLVVPWGFARTQSFSVSGTLRIQRFHMARTRDSLTEPQ